MRILVAIGCDHYSNDGLQDLSGAENDASAVFDLLVNSDGFYDKKHSIILKSPSFQEAKEALQQAIFDSSEDIQLCLFFAGHGGVKDGAYFLCVNDTAVDRLTISAISITDLFMWINEAKIRDSNIVIDACQAGGIAYDVATFLKPGVIGRLGSPSISVLASAAADQEAREIGGQGVATSAILKCLSGEVIVQTDHPSLSLNDVGHTVAELMENEHQQAPVYWGLNLFGRSLFSKNPHFEDQKTPIIGLPEDLNSSAEDEPIIRAHTNKVWELYLSSSKEFNAIHFLRMTQSILSDLPSTSTAAPIVVDGLANTFQHLLTESNDPFEEVELLGSCIAALLQYDNGDDVVTNVMNSISNRLLKSIYSATDHVLNSIEENRFSLLSERSVLADLYYLPIRILKILGWIGAGQYFATLLRDESSEIIQINQKLVRTILKEYTNAIVAVSDEQTCNSIIFLCMAESMGLLDEAEQLFGLLCHTFCNYDGVISHSQLSGSDAYRFIKGRANADKSAYEDLISSPTEFLSALILLSNKLSLADIVDDVIEQFDHASANLFIPDSYSSFADERIDNGVNYTFIIGHDIWCVKDFMGLWATIRGKLDGDPSLKSPSTRIAAVCSALIQPDRTPWFIYE
jgi:hypothetical protein